MRWSSWGGSSGCAVGFALTRKSSRPSNKAFKRSGTTKTGCLLQDGLSSVMREHRSAHPNCFLAVAEGKLVDYDPMLAALLLRTRDLRSTTHVTIIPPLSG
jgi:hypothetical protein